MDTKTVVHGNDIRQKLSSWRRLLRSLEPLMKVMMHLLKRIQPQTNRTTLTEHPVITLFMSMLSYSVVHLDRTPTQSSWRYSSSFDGNWKFHLFEHQDRRSQTLLTMTQSKLKSSFSPQDIQSPSCNKPEIWHGGEVIGEDLVPESPNTGAKQKIL